MATFISHSPADTEALGEAWGRAAQTGWVIGLQGDLGAGKTQLVRGLARGLGFAGRVHSPTFALVNHYADARLPLFHLDLYRLETPAQIAAAGLDEYLHAPAGIAVVEWIERWFPTAASAGFVAPAGMRFRHVRLETLSETTRRITYEDSGI